MTVGAARRDTVLAQAMLDSRDSNAARRYAESALAAGYEPARELCIAAAYLGRDFVRAIRLLEEVKAPGAAEYALLIRLQLLAGDQEVGWRLLYDCCRSELFGPPLYDLPFWSGEPLRGRRIVAWGAGQGDEILFARFLPLLIARGAVVTVNCRSSMVRLLCSVGGLRQVLPLDVSANDVELQLRMAELPALLRIGAEEIWPGPYLHAPPIRIPGEGLRVGLVWGSDARHLEARDRTVSLADMAPLAAVPGVQLFSLQLGKSRVEAAVPPTGMQIADLAPGIGDFADTAGAVSALDLVIGIDTAVSNLAGALGARVWVAVPVVPDWRWGHTGNSTPWYPTATVYRQSRPDDWKMVFEVMARDLAALVKNQQLSRPL
jgi:hypothetical protein